MLTTFEQVRDWITDNGFKRWVLYKDRSKTEKILDSANYPSDIEDKLAMTEKYLRYAGGNAYAAGAPNNAVNDLTTICEIRLSDGQSAQPTQGVGNNYPTIGELTETITKQVRAEMAAEDFKRREKELAEREREFNEKQNGVIGALVGVLSPYLPVLNQVAGMRKVAGVDVAEPLHAQPIIPEAQEQEPQETEEQPQEEQSPFTDEEADELFALMAEFKRVEPDYLKMIRKVVDMAKANDTTYQMAKKFLV